MSFPRLLDTSTLSHYFGTRAREKSPALVNYVEEVIAVDGSRLSTITMYELERGLRKLELGGQGRTKRRLLTMFLASTTIYSLDDSHGSGWYLAADLHARAAVRSPAVVFGEADLLILATALFHELALVTSDAGFAEQARALGHGRQLIELPLA